VLNAAGAGSASELPLLFNIQAQNSFAKIKLKKKFFFRKKKQTRQADLVAFLQQHS
jgi:hypothetical protein